MAMLIDGKMQPTIADAASKLGVSVKTVKAWIDSGFAPEPPVAQQGRREIQLFPDSWVQETKRKIADERKKKREEHLKRKPKS